MVLVVQSLVGGDSKAADGTPDQQARPDATVLASGPYSDANIPERDLDRFEWLVQAAANAAPRGSYAMVVSQDGLLASSVQLNVSADKAQVDDPTRIPTCRCSIGSRRSSHGYERACPRHSAEAMTRNSLVRAGGVR